MKIRQMAVKYGSKLEKFAVGGALLSVAGLSSATSLIDWSSLATGVTGEATAAITAGVGVLALFLGVAGGVRMFRKFIG